MATKSRPQPRNCLYEKCGIEFTPNPKHPDQKFHKPTCRVKAHMQRNFVNVSKPTPEQIEKAKAFIDSQIPRQVGTMKDGNIIMSYDISPTKTTAELDKIFANKPPRKKKPSDFLKRIGFTPAELGTIVTWAKEFIKHEHAAEILRKVSR